MCAYEVLVQFVLPRQIVGHFLVEVDHITLC